MYIFVFLSSLILYFIGLKTKRLTAFWVLTLLLILVCGFRGEFIGRDTQSYHELYNLAASGDVILVNELGYALFLKTIVAIGGTQQLVFLLFAGFTMFFFSKFIIRYSKEPYLSLLIFIFVSPFYLSTFNQIRQYLSISVFLYFLLPLIENRKFILFFLIVLVSTFFIHVSILLMTPFYFILTKKISFKEKFLYLAVFNLCIGLIISVVLSTPYGYFIIRRSEIEADLKMFAIQIVISFFILLFEKNISDGTKRSIMFFNMTYFSLFMLTAIFLNSKLPSEIFSRMNNFFFPCIIIIFPEILFRFEKSSRNVLTGILIVFLSLYFIRSSIMLGEMYNIAPYDFNLKLFK